MELKIEDCRLKIEDCMELMVVWNWRLYGIEDCMEL